jgi:hypothetical protein
MIRDPSSTPSVTVADDGRREALFVDLERLAHGWRPDAATLAAAPLIDRWSIVNFPGTTELAMQGYVTGHPTLHDGPVTTSPIYAADFSVGWIRTQGRFYRLGRRAVVAQQSRGLR